MTQRTTVKLPRNLVDRVRMHVTKLKNKGMNVSISKVISVAVELHLPAKKK